MKGKILIVDDESDILSALKDILEIEDYEIMEAVNGKEAYNILQKTKPDLLITDVMMPLLDGLSLVKLIRTELKEQKMPILLMSAAGPYLEEDNPGWNVFIKKPIDLDRLLCEISTLITNK